MDAVARTARWVAAVRARESARPDRLFEDSLAAQFAGPPGFAWLEGADTVQAGSSRDSALYLALRTRYFDDYLLQVTRTEGLRQVVLPAAGMDARAFRLEWPEGTRLFELDRPELFAVKEGVLAETGTYPRCARHIVPVDLAQPWRDDLIRAGFEPAEPTLWLVEGLLVYLFEAEAHLLLERLTHLSAPGSRLGADLGNTALLTSAEMEPWHRMLEERGCPWRFGTDDPVGFFRQHGWQAEVMRSGDLGATYGRHREQPTADHPLHSPANWLIDAYR